jgi:hypothetical protein
MKKLNFVSALLVLLLFGMQASFAQTFEDYKKQRQQEMQQFKEDREKGLQALANEFSDYVEKQDKAYSAYLKQRWEEYQIFQGLAAPQEPKPEIVPEYEEPTKPLPFNPIPVRKPVPDEGPVFVPAPVLPRITRQEPDDFPSHEKSFQFYGFPIVFDYDPKLAAVKLQGQPNEEAISQAFDQLSQSNYNSLLEQFYDYSQMLNLNDLGYYRLLSQTAQSLAPNDENTQKILNWFLLVRSGYKAKVAYFDRDIFILLPIKNQVYDVKYFQLDGLTYYLLEGNTTNIYTYKKDFPDAQKLFDLNLHKSIALGEETLNKAIPFQYEGKDYNITVNYNKNVIDFYQDYPLADIKIYFDAMVSPEAKASLSEALLPLISGMSEVEAVNFLLHFVQTGFDYQTDQEQFGYEKFFFAEEAFHYPYCDCEDRSVLFSYLVQSLTKLRVIGLNYPGHVATAVCFNEDVGGDYLDFEGLKYVVSDPTYINAPVGLTMPQYKNQEAKIVVLENKFTGRRMQDNLWDDIIAAGGRRGDNGQDMITNQDGSTLITGYYSNAFKYADIAVAAADKPAMFAMMVDENRQPLWFSNSTGAGTAMAYHTAYDKQGNYYVSGTFSGEMEIGNQIVESTNEQSDIFLARFKANGELQWLKNANIDTANLNGETGYDYLNFTLRFSRDGQSLANELFFETGDFDNYGISIQASGEIVVAGAFNKTTGMNIKRLLFNAGESFDAIEAIKAENDRLISENYEKTIAGLFAIVNLVQSSGLSIPGSAARDVLDKYNPEFKEEFPSIFKTITKVNFIKNEQGIVTIKTDGGKDLPIDMMRVKNDAQIKIAMLENGDARIEVLSGIRVGKAMWWYDLNHIVLYKTNGDLLFDYDADHSTVVKNLHADLLY